MGISAADWGKGIGLSILASWIGAASKLAIRKSWLIQAAPPLAASLQQNTSSDSEPSRPTQQHQQRREWPKWVPYLTRYSGMFGMSVLNPICCVLAMNYASPSILAPFSGLTLVWVILFSHPVVGEIPSTQQIVAACFIIAGEVIVAIFGDHTNDEGVSVDDVKQSYQEPWFVAYLVALALYMLLLAYWMYLSPHPILRRFAWGSCGGAVTGVQNFLKDSLTIIKATPHGESYPWCLPLFMFSAAASAFVGLLFLTACMKRYDATYSAASFVGSFVVSASIMSAVHYNTFSELQGLVNYILYPTGLAVLMVGVYLLVLESQDRRANEPDEDGDDDSDVDNGDVPEEVPFMYTQLDGDTETTENQMA